MKNLRQTLYESGYSQFYLFFGEMNMRYRDWSVAAVGLRTPLKLLVSLFLLGEAVPLAQATRVVGAEATQHLIEARILKSEGNSLQSNSFHLVIHRGLYYFCQVTGEPFAYLGEDSIALGQYQTPRWNGAVLDLCSGPGIQGMYAAQRGNRVTAVEQSAAACGVQRVNLELNQLGDRVTLINARAEEFAKQGTQTWDQILFNPPLVPLPGKVESPSVRHGGRDGLVLVRQILRDYQPRLSPGGCFEFVGMSLIKGRGKRVESPLLALAKQEKLSGRMHLLSRHQIGGNGMVFAMHAASVARAEATSAQTARRELAAEYGDYQDFFLYYACLHASKIRQRPEVAVMDMSVTHYGGWFS